MIAVPSIGGSRTMPVQPRSWRIRNGIPAWSYAGGLDRAWYDLRTNAMRRGGGIIHSRHGEHDAGRSEDPVVGGHMGHRPKDVPANTRPVRGRSLACGDVAYGPLIVGVEVGPLTVEM